MAAPDLHEPPGALLVTAMATVGFFAIAIFGLGALSALTDADIIAVPGLGQAPGVFGMIMAMVVFFGILWPATRSTQPRFSFVWTIALATTLAHLLTVAVGVLAASGNVVAALAVMGGFITGGASGVVLGAAAVAAWVALALRRTRAGRAKWPWENEEPDPE